MADYWDHPADTNSPPVPGDTSVTTSKGHSALSPKRGMLPTMPQSTPGSGRRSILAAPRSNAPTHTHYRLIAHPIERPPDLAAFHMPQMTWQSPKVANAAKPSHIDASGSGSRLPDRTCSPAAQPETAGGGTNHPLPHCCGAGALMTRAVHRTCSNRHSRPSADGCTS